jgi:hypothetical protein
MHQPSLFNIMNMRDNRIDSLEWLRGDKNTTRKSPPTNHIQ